MKDQGKIKSDERKVHRYPPSSSAHSLSSPSLNNASCSSRSSLAAPSPSSSTGGPDVLPTSVVARKTRTAWLQRSSASRHLVRKREVEDRREVTLAASDKQ